MYRLKRSKFIKTVCFILSIMLFAVSYANIFLICAVIDQNLNNIDKEVFTEKIYSYAAQYTATEAMIYYQYKTDELSDYGFKQTKTYESAFSEERSNASFVIKDENGKVLFRNYDMGKDYSFAFNFSKDYYVYSDGKAYAQEENITEVLTTMPDTEPSTPAPDEQETSGSAEAAALFGKEYSVYVENSEDTGIPYSFKYIYPAENRTFDSRILSYCQELYYEEKFRNGDSPYYGIKSNNYIVFFEENFLISVNNQVYFNENPVRDYTDLPTSATEQPINSDNYTAIPVTVTVFVKNEINKDARDIYRYISPLMDFGYFYSQHIFAMTAVFGILAVAMFIFMLVLCGYSKTSEVPVANGIHKLPFDVLLLIYSAFAIAIFAIVCEVTPLFTLVFALPAAFILILFFTETTAVRIKAKSFNFITVKFLRFIKRQCKRFFGKAKKVIRRLSDNTGILIKAAVIFVALGIFTFFLAVLDGEAGGCLWFAGLIIAAGIFVVLTYDINILQNAAKDISDGKGGKQIHSRLLFGELRKNAGYLNGINSSVESAIQDRLKSERMKTELITNVSHDLKTPLTSIVNYIDLLKKEEISNDKAAEYIEIIDRQSQRLKKLTFDVVEASKAATGNIKINFESTDLNMLLNQTVGEYSDKLTEAALEPVVLLPENPVKIFADGRLLWRVFDNLMNNICKYSMPNTRVYISLEKTGEKAQVIFRNISGNKLNISPDELTERFVRGDAARNTEGSGLGLSIANSLISSMHGKMDIAIDGDLFKIVIEFFAI